MIVGDILDLYGGLRDCEILTNRQTRNNVIKNVSLFEVPDGMFWTKENEFLITTGYFLKESNLNLIDVLRTLINNECAGIGIKLGRFINEISNDVIEYANKYNFAIVKIPVEITYNDMLLPMISFLNEDSNYINNESVKFSKEIHSIMYNQGDLNDFYNILKYRFNYKIDYFIINYDNHHIDEKLLKSIKVFTEYNLPNIFRNYISDFNTYKIGTSENEYIILPIFNFNRVSSFICISTKYKIKKMI